MCSNAQATVSLGLSQVLGVLGFFLACTSLGWQIWIYFLNRKEDIRGDLTFDSKSLGPGNNVHGLFLELYNNGSVPVYIASVSLAWGDEKAKVGHLVTKLQFQPFGKHEGPLKQGDGRRCYVLAKDFLLMNKEASNQPEEKIWVSVESAKGEVLRIKGDKVLFLVKSLCGICDNEKTV